MDYEVDFHTLGRALLREDSICTYILEAHFPTVIQLHIFF